MGEAQETMVHADSAVGDGRTLCGDAYEGDDEDGFTRRTVAGPHEFVDCPTCRKIIVYCHTLYTPNCRLRA